MVDARRLCEYLTAALLASGCDRGASPARQPPTGSSGPSLSLHALDAAPTAGSQLGGGGSSQVHCQQGSWCADAADARIVTNNEGERLGCPVALYTYTAFGSARPTPAAWPAENPSVMHLDDAATTARRASGSSASTSCCYDYEYHCLGGRPLLVAGIPQLAPAPHIDDPRAARWLAEARAEHASIASFARAALELLAVGAPPALLVEVADAMRDEVRHAEACFALAARFAARPIEPGPLPAALPREASVVRVACDTFLEGCVGETIAILAMTRELATCSDPVVANVLEMMIADELRHAALAWKTLAWAIAVEPAAATAVRALAVPPPDADATVADAWREIILPTLATLA